jgi:hypothetical protein
MYVFIYIYIYIHMYVYIYSRNIPLEDEGCRVLVVNLNDVFLPIDMYTIMYNYLNTRKCTYKHIDITLLIKSIILFKEYTIRR